ncbi:MAG: hypothetical protein ACTHMS_03210 [Jatrophihabitans sp.]|uniref:hypothetical protein n=1 Tax=Jatrophihabitans sp. TaxID=1932789 RepID=UPI003F7F2756
MGINDEAARQAQRERDQMRREQERASTAQAERLAVEELARKFGQWAASQGWPHTYKEGWRTRGWYVLNDQVAPSDGGRSYDHRILAVTTDGEVSAANVSLAAAQQAIVDTVRRTGARWPFDD